MFELSVGNKWEIPFLEALASLNDRYGGNGIRVGEIYGSLRSETTGLVSARPDYRIPDFPLLKLRDYVKRSHDYKIKINYTINAPLSTSVAEFARSADAIRSMVLKLQDAGIDLFTVANSLLIEMLRTIPGLELEASSVMHIQSTAQVSILADWNIRRICMDVTRNRDVSFLRNFNKACEQHGIVVKLLANEFCNVNGAPCAGLYQQDCVLHSALGGNEDGLCDGWPFQRCSSGRQGNPASWLKSRFILPQWMERYREATGIRTFKITGRTCRTSWLLRVIEDYLRREFLGDIRDLWIDPGAKYDCNSAEHESGDAVLQGSYLDEIDFIGFWLRNPDFRCDMHCRLDCRFCEKCATNLTILDQHASASPRQAQRQSPLAATVFTNRKRGGRVV